MAAVLKITRSTVLANNDGEYSPGDLLNHTAVISHDVASNATAFNLALSDTFLNSTIVAGSINVSPIALNDSFTAVGNTMLVVGGLGTTAAGLVAAGTETTSVSANVMGNDFDPLGGSPLQVVAASGTTSLGGTFNVQADGSFTYISQAGDTGTDTFTYTITDGKLTSTATVSITLAGQVWYVDGSKAANGDGTSANPFNTLTSIASTAGIDTGDYIHVEGTLAGSVILETNQQLIGDGTAFSVLGIAISDVAADGQAVINPTTGVYGITLATGNTIAGVDVGSGGAGNGISGSNFGNATISDVTVNVAGQGLNLSTGNFVAADFNSVTSTAGTNNISLTSVTGNVNLGGGTLSGATGVGVSITGGNGSVDYNGTVTHAANAFAVSVTNKTGGTVDFDGAVTSNTASDGVNLQNNTGATVNFDGGLTINTSASGTAGFTATGGGTVSVTGAANTVNSGAGSAINVSSTTIGATGMTFLSVTSTGGTNSGIILSNAGTGGFNVTGTGTTDNSGGVISGKTGANGGELTGTGIYINNTDNVSIKNVTLNNNENYGIRAEDSTNLRITDTIFTNSGNTADGVTREGSIRLDQVDGNVAIINNDIGGGHMHNVVIDNQSGTLNLNFTGNYVHDTETVGGDDGLTIEAELTATMFLNITNNRFAAHGGDQFNMSLINNANVDLTFTNNDLDGGHTNSLGQGIFVLGSTFNGSFDYNISNNGTAADPIDGNVQGGAIFVTQGSGTGTFSGTIANNVIGDPAIANSGSVQASGIVVSQRGNGTHTVVLDGNKVYQYEDRGIIVEAGEGNGTLNATVINNLVSNYADNINSLHGLHFDFGFLAADNGIVNLDVRNNNLANAANESQGGVDMRVRVGSGIDVFLEGYTGGNNDAAFDTHLQNTNTVNDPINGTGGVAVTTPGATATVNNYVGNVPMPAGPTLPPAAMFVEPGTGPAQNDTDLATGGTGPAGPAVVDDGVLSQAELALVVAAAIARWEAAGATPEQIAAMRAVAFSVEDIGGLTIGASSVGAITIDDNAAGFNWFVDATPGDDSEFAGSGTQLRATSDYGAAGTRIDLLTVVTHELGHQIGLNDLTVPGERDELMYGSIAVGERRLPGADDASGAAPGAAPVSADITVATGIAQLPTYQTVTVTYQSTVNAPARNGLAGNVGGVATVTADSGVIANSNAESAAIDSLSFGGQIFRDTNKNGIRDAGETGIAGVTLKLYADTSISNGNGDRFDAGDTLIALTATTDANGNYRFAGLAEGDYIAVAGASNFAAGGALFGLTSADGVVDPDTVAAVPTNAIGSTDNNILGDDNAEMVGGELATRAVTLTYDTEPVNDGDFDADTNLTVDMAVIAPNQAPVIANLQGNTVAFTEGGAAVRIDQGGDAAVSDSDSATYNGGTLTVAITGNKVAAEDLLGIDQNGTGVTVSGSTVSVGGTAIGTFAGGGASDYVFTFNGNATDAAVQSLIRAVTYANSNGAEPSTATRTISFTLNDGGGTAGGGDPDVTVTSTVTITPVNDAPEGQDRTGVTVGDTGQYVFTAADFTTGATDPEGDAIQAVKITTLPGASAGVLMFDADGAGPNPATAVAAGDVISIADIGAGKLVFVPAANSGGVALSFTFQIQDDGSPAPAFDATPNTFSTTITASNASPVVDLNGGAAGNDTTLALNEGNGARAAPDATLTDSDSANFDGGSLTVSFGAAANAADGIGVLDNGGRTQTGGRIGVNNNDVYYDTVLIGTMSGGNGTPLVVTFNSSATPAAAQELVRSVNVYNGSDTPPAGPRNLVFTVTDGDGGTGSAVAVVTIAAVNDVPVVALADSTVSGTEDSNLVFNTANGNAITVSDADDGSVTVTLTVANGILTLAQTTGLTTVTGNGSATVVLAGSLANVNAALEGLTYRGGLNYEGQDSLKVEVADATSSSSDTVTITLADDGKIDGTAGNDTIVGTTGADKMVGYGGDDTYTVDNEGDEVVEDFNGGNDTVRGSIGSATDYTKLYSLPANVENFVGTNAAGQGVFDNVLSNTITMAAGADLVVITGGGSDTVSTGAGNDFVFVGEAWDAGDSINGGADYDTVGFSGGGTYAFEANDFSGVEQLSFYGGFVVPPSEAAYTVTLNDGNVDAGKKMLVSFQSVAGIVTFNGAAELDGDLSVIGGASGDSIIGGSGKDYLQGRAGADTLNGGIGQDTLVGGAGSDTLYGGSGKDFFRFESVDDSNGADSTDVIQDFALSNADERIDLSAIDADAGQDGNQAFTFVGTADFSHVAGELRVVQDGNNWLVQGDVDGDGTADLVIQVSNNPEILWGSQHFLL
ncbi:MAG TPA: Ig-like domain-containing protein [Allosphingosinicella sp.]|jgi:hypothetical protein